jgi:hypothetical protein
MGYQLIKYSVNSGDIYVRNDEKILFISHPYYRIDRIEITENQLINSENSLHDTFIQSHKDFESLEDIVDFINHKYIENIKENPVFEYNKVLLEKCINKDVVIERHGRIQKRREKRKKTGIQFSAHKTNPSTTAEVEKFIEALKGKNRRFKNFSTPNQPSPNANIQNSLYVV